MEIDFCISFRNLSNQFVKSIYAGEVTIVFPDNWLDFGNASTVQVNCDSGKYFSQIWFDKLLKFDQNEFQSHIQNPVKHLRWRLL